MSAVHTLAGYSQSTAAEKNIIALQLLRPEQSHQHKRLDRRARRNYSARRGLHSLPRDDLARLNFNHEGRSRPAGHARTNRFLQKSSSDVLRILPHGDGLLCLSREAEQQRAKQGYDRKAMLELWKEHATRLHRIVIFVQPNLSFS